jgi:hypothetical protein
LAEQAPQQFEAILNSADRRYTRVVIALGDRLSERWLGRSNTPYAAEIHAIARTLPRRGAYFLNLSYEWACTTGAANDPALGGPTMLRVLDWPFHGLGRSLVAADVSGPAGAYLSLTWPGFAGMLTGMAHGRFAAAMNQTPMPYSGLGRIGDWVMSRGDVWRSTALPPTHLLRLAFDTCRTFAEARQLLAEREIASPAFFVLGGIEDGEYCLIERTRREAKISPSACVANHWRFFDLRGTPRGHESLARGQRLEELLESAPDWDLNWLRAPILNPDTRLVAMMNARSGRVVAQGWEADGAATERLTYGRQP